MAKKVNYWDPQGNQQEGWYDSGKVYKDEGLTERIDKGSSFQNSKGQVYRMGQYGGTKVYNPTQTDKAGNWVPTGNDWYRQAQQMMFNIQDRPKFEFDLNQNALYQQYKQNYMKQGQQAMMDTMGQAAGLTGGYGSSYAQNVGQQAYNDYLTKLGDIVPELYAQERAAYDAEGDQMYRQMQAALGMYDLDYQNWRNKVSDTRYRDELAYGRGRDALADQRYADELAYGRSRDALSDQRYADELAYGRSRDAITDQRYADQLAYDRSRDALSDQWREREWNESHRDENYSRVMQMLSAGYMPSAEELQAAGISQSYAQYLVNRYAAAQAPAQGSTGGSNPPGYVPGYNPTPTPTPTPTDPPDLGTTVDGKPVEAMPAGYDVNRIRSWCMGAENQASAKQRLNRYSRYLTAEQYNTIYQLILGGWGTGNYLV